MSNIISVIVPIYKVEKYLRECIDSILNQTYTNLEVLLIDDGSPDNCPKICNEYAKMDSRVKVIHKANGGLSDARNVGIDTATGNYIVFVDSDDVIDETMIEKLYLNLTKYNADISECEYVFTKQIPTKIKEKEIQKDEYNNIEALNSMYVCGGCKVVAWNKMYKRELFNDIKYPVGKLHEDVFTTYKLLFKANKVVHTNEILYFYRNRNDSIVNQFNEKRLDVCEAFNEINLFYTKINQENLVMKNLRNALNTLLRFYTYTNARCIRKKIRMNFRYFAKKYNGVTKGISLLKIRYYIFLLFPSLDNLFIRIVDKKRGEV